jgi:hypothetical protein
MTVTIHFMRTSDSNFPASGFVVRILNYPIRFLAVGDGGRSYTEVPTDLEATVFESREEAVVCLQKRRIGFKGVAIVEIPAPARRAAT